MITKIGPSPVLDGAARAPSPAPPPKDPALHKAAQEFEAMLLRQILSEAKLTGHATETGYDGMAVDALAGSVAKTGGLGFAQKLEASLSGHVAQTAKGAQGAEAPPSATSAAPTPSPEPATWRGAAKK